VTGRRRRLAERRKALGYSQEALAEKLGVDRTTVGRWERGESDPHPYIRPRLRRVMNAAADEIEILLASDAHDEPNPRVAPAVACGPVPGPDPMGELDDMYRRELLRLLSVGGVLIALPRNPAATEPEQIAPAGDPADIGQHVLLNAHLWQVFALAKSKRLVYPLVRDQLSLLVDQMNRPCSPQARQQLCVLACDLFQLAGEIFFDSNRYTDAAYCYTLAANAGREARSYDRWACALTRQAFISMYDRQFPDATAILSAAARVAQRGDSQLPTRHWVAVVQAQADAGRGDLEACQRALDTAERVTGLDGSASPGGWLRFDGSRLAEERGTCYLSLGRADIAETALTEALRHAVSLRRRGSLLADLAILGVQRHDLDRLLRYGEDAIDLAGQTQSSGYVGRKLQALNAQLQPFQADHRIAQLSDRIASLSITALGEEPSWTPGPPTKAGSSARHGSPAYASTTPASRSPATSPRGTTPRTGNARPPRPSAARYAPSPRSATATPPI
jgi:transcriptional regulator with XRE-family HTH domain